MASPGRLCSSLQAVLEMERIHIILIYFKKKGYKNIKTDMCVLYIYMHHFCDFFLVLRSVLYLLVC